MKLNWSKNLGDNSEGNWGENWTENFWKWKHISKMNAHFENESTFRKWKHIPKMKAHFETVQTIEKRLLNVSNQYSAPKFSALETLISELAVCYIWQLSKLYDNDKSRLIRPWNPPIFLIEILLDQQQTQ